MSVRFPVHGSAYDVVRVPHPASFHRRAVQASDHLLAVERPRLVGELLLSRLQRLYVGPVRGLEKGRGPKKWPENGQMGVN